MQHCTKMEVEQLATLPFQRPVEAGRLWWGVPHAELADAFLTAAFQVGWNREDALAFVSPDGKELLLTAHLRGAVDRFVLGLQASHTRRRSMKVFLGIEENSGGCVVWLDCLTFGRCSLHPQTPLAQIAAAGLKWFNAAAKKSGKEIAQLKRKKLTSPQATELLLTAGSGHQNARSLPPTRATRLIVNGYREDGYKTAWELLAAVAGAARHNPPLLAPEQVYRFKVLLDKEI